MRDRLVAERMRRGRKGERESREKYFELNRQKKSNDILFSKVVGFTFMLMYIISDRYREELTSR